MAFRKESFEDHYELGRRIGHGHFADVFQCRCPRSRKEFAAKFIRLRRTKTSKLGMDLVDIEREAGVLRLLSHDNIITYKEAFHNKTTVVLVLELVQGGELFDYLSQKEKLTEEDGSHFVQQILGGVHHMHCLHIVHLDLKPENILIEDLKSRKIKIVDFGLARRLNANVAYQGIQGTADYIAPEIINYDPVSFGTDMWAIGVICFMLLSGVSPFGGETQQETFENISHCDFDIECEELIEISDLARDFILKLLIKDPKERSLTSECLKHPWIQPKEKSQAQRRRSSLIRRENLVNLKKFVMADHSDVSASGGSGSDVDENTPPSPRYLMRRSRGSASLLPFCPSSLSPGLLKTVLSHTEEESSPTPGSPDTSDVEEQEDDHRVITVPNCCTRGLSPVEEAPGSMAASPDSAS